MTTLEWILISYILLNNLWVIIFVNSKRKTTHKNWFIVMTLIFMPISMIFLGIQVSLEESKCKKEKK